MSAEERRDKMQQMLANLRAKRSGAGTTSQGSSSVGTLDFSRSPESPEKSVLVPPSSSPAPTPTSKFFGGNAGASTSSSNTNNTLKMNAIPSSILNRPATMTTNGVNGSTKNGTSGGGFSDGSPAAIMSAIQHRKTGGDNPRPAGASSLNYELSPPSMSKPNIPSSPSSPPLSRLKSKYQNDETPSKSQVSTSPSPTVATSASGTPGSLKRTPSLIAAAKLQASSSKDAKFNRLKAVYPLVSESRIREAIRIWGDKDGMLNDILRKENREANMSKSTSTSGSSFSIPRSAVKQPPNPSSSTSLRPPVTSSSSTSTDIAVVQHPSTSSFDDSPKQSKVKPAPKPKKNEKSHIYTNRTNRKRDPDEEETEGEAEEEGSEAESANDWSGDEGRKKKRRKYGSEDEDEVDAEGAALKAFNNDTVEVLTGTIACSADQANIIIKHRPYSDLDDLRTKLNKARGVSIKLFEQYTEIMEGYVQIDACLNRCEAIAKDIANTLTVWRSASEASDSSVIGTPRADGLNDVKVDIKKVNELLLNEKDVKRRKALSQYIKEQPRTLSEGTVLKDYQLLGVNWLNLLWSKRIGCILADEMGLGKTIQVIAFIAHLHERGVKGPHMIFVPASTLENWIREFERFAPSIKLDSYYGSQAERAEIRHDLKTKFRRGKLEVVLASYTQVTSHDDLAFFRKKIDFETCIYDEGHRLKNCTTKAYTDLLSIKPKWRCLLTGTPLQNNLQELVSLLIFIHKDVFTDAEPYLRAIFKSQSQANQLSQQRVSRARTMLTPFVLRRRKAHVLQLPPKTERVHECEMSKSQEKIYRETMQRSKKILEEMDDDTLAEMAGQDEEAENKKKSAIPKKPAPKKAVAASSGAHVIMDLRKAASHPLLFRKKYTSATIKKIAKECLNTPRWCDANLDYVIEDLEIMSDAELSHFCRESEFESLQKFALDSEVYLEGGKVAALQEIIQKCQKEGKRILLFSQFVMILDILEVALQHLDVRYTRLDGSTKTDERQGLVDEFNEDSDITLFLLSTKAGGVGINLTAASVVVIYDQDFNPHNDRQAADRAYRIGQEREVEVIKLITKGSIDEDMLNIGITKLQLDDAVGGEEIALDGDAGAGKEDKTAKEMRKSLLTTLRNKFDLGGPGQTTSLDEIKEEEMTVDSKKEVKKARGSIAVKEGEPLEVKEEETEPIKVE